MRETPPFRFPSPGSKFILLTIEPDGKTSIQTSDPTTASRASMAAALSDIADRLAADESGAVLLG